MPSFFLIVSLTILYSSCPNIFITPENITDTYPDFIYGLLKRDRPNQNNQPFDDKSRSSSAAKMLIDNSVEDVAIGANDEAFVSKPLESTGFSQNYILARRKRGLWSFVKQQVLPQKPTEKPANATHDSGLADNNGGVAAGFLSVGKKLGGAFKVVGQAAVPVVAQVGKAAVPVIRQIGGVAAPVAHRIGKAAAPLVLKVGEAAAPAVSGVGSKIMTAGGEAMGKAPSIAASGLHEAASYLPAQEKSVPAPEQRAIELREENKRLKKKLSKEERIIGELKAPGTPPPRKKLKKHQTFNKIHAAHGKPVLLTNIAVEEPLVLAEAARRREHHWKNPDGTQSLAALSAHSNHQGRRPLKPWRTTTDGSAGDINQAQPNGAVESQDESEAPVPVTRQQKLQILRQERISKADTFNKLILDPESEVEIPVQDGLPDFSRGNGIGEENNYRAVHRIADESAPRLNGRISNIAVTFYLAPESQYGPEQDYGDPVVTRKPYGANRGRRRKGRRDAHKGRRRRVTD